MSVFDIFETNLKSKIDASTADQGSQRKSTLHLSKVESRKDSLGLQLFVKRVMDIVLSITLMILLAPVFLFTYFLVRFNSPGPALFSQYRWGKDGRQIRVYKFRSMKLESCDESGVDQTTENDPRLTSIGSFLRQSNIDELPQLYNVLKGDMSLVGPRCHVPGMLAAGQLYEDLVPAYHDRHKVRPGLTGLAQVRGFRGPTVRADKARARIASDLYYVENFSIWLDIKILIATIIVEFRGGRGF